MPRLNPFASGRTTLTKLWNANIDGHVVALVWSAALDVIAAASADGPIALLDAKTGQIRCNLPGHGFGTSCLAWSADGQLLASGGQDGKVRLWNASTGQQTRDMTAGAAWVERLAWCPVANVLASAAGKKLRLWHPDGALVREFADHPSTIADIQWKPADLVLTSTAYGKVFLWDGNPIPSGTSTNDLPREFAWQGSMLALAWSPNAEFLAAGLQDGSVHFWVMKTGEDLQMSGYPTKVRELAWDHTSRYLATGGGPMPCVWDFSGEGPEGTTPLQLDAHKANVSCLAFQHRGPILASGGEDGLLALWQPGKQLGTLALAKHADPITQLAWADDDRRLAVSTATGDVLLYATRPPHVPG